MTVPSLPFACLTSALALALTTRLAPAQQPGQPTATVTAPAADSAAPGAPIERRLPNQDHPSAQPGPRPSHFRGGRDGRPNLRAGNEAPGNFRGDNFRQGPHNFRGQQFHRMNADFYPGPRAEWWKNPMLAQHLALTPEQTKKLDTISQQSRLHLIDLRANLERQQALLEPLLQANPVDTTRALAQVDKLAEARAALEESQAKTALTLRAVLTPDQWTQLSDHRGPNRFGPKSGHPSPENDNTGGRPSANQGGPTRWHRNQGPPPNASNLTDSPINAQ